MSRLLFALSVVLILLLAAGATASYSRSSSYNTTYPDVGWTRVESTNHAGAVFSLRIWQSAIPNHQSYYNPTQATFRVVGGKGGDAGVVTFIYGYQSTSSAAGPTATVYNDGYTFTPNYVETIVVVNPTTGTSTYAILYFYPLGVDYSECYITGDTGCVDNTALYISDNNGGYGLVEDTTSDAYNFTIMPGFTYRMLFDGYYHDFTCDGSDIVFDFDICMWVYGYTCGVDTIKLYVDDGGWVLNDTESQDVGYDVYEMPIVDGEDYKISFIDSTIDGDFVVHNQTFSCIGDHVPIDYDRCNWVYPPYPPAPPYIIYLWTGYDYNIVVFRDEHGNFIENSQLAIYDKTDSQYIQRWTDAGDGYTLLGARFDTDHDVQLMLRTFDGIFTLDTTHPANGSAAVGEEVITTTNWTIPIKYNLNVLPVDQYGAALFDVFCGLSEYTPLNPGVFWGMDLSDQGYVAVTNCSGFAMCDIIAEKDGYTDYKVEALNWTSKSALVKDYRHNVVMEEE